MRSLLLAAIALGLVWAWHASRATTTPPPSSGGDPLRQQHASPVGASLDAPVVLADRTALAPPALLPPAGDHGLTPIRTQLEIVTADGAPAAGAEVLFLPPMSEQAISDWYSDDEPDVEQALRRLGARAIADAEGVVELATMDDLPVAARLGEHFGSDSLSIPEPGEPRPRLVLHRDVTLRVRVTDTTGAPVAGLRIDYELQGTDLRRGRLDRSGDFGETDAEGRVVVHHLQHEYELADDPYGTLQLFVESYAERHQRSVASATLPLRQLRGSVEVALTTTARGSITVTLAGADGAPIELHVALAEPGRDEWRRSHGRGGRYLFTGVPIGRRWNVRAAVGYFGNPEPIVVQVDGPRAAGEDVPVAIAVPLRAFDFRARVERADGNPVGGAVVRLRAAGQVRATAHVSANDNGLIEFPTLYVPTGIERLDGVELQFHAPGLSTQPVVVPGSFPPGTIDLGTIVAAPHADEVVLATVELRRGGEPFLERGFVEPFVIEDSSRWASHPATVRRDGGTWTLRGRVPEQPLHVRCRAGDFIEVVLRDLPTGAHRIVDLQDAARLIVLVTTPDVPGEALSACLTPVAGGREIFEQVDEEQQRIEWYGVVPGRYTLRVLARQRELVRLPPFDLQPGLQTLPRDGSRLDLRGLVRACRLMATSTKDGSPVEPIAVLVPPNEHELDCGEDFLFRDGWFLVGGPPVDLLVRGRDHVPVRLRAVDRDVRAALQPITELEVELPEGIDEYEDIVGRLVHDPVEDALLRKFWDDMEHAEHFSADDSTLRFAPGAVVEFRLVRDGVAGPAVRVEVGDESPQTVRLVR